LSQKGNKKKSRHKASTLSKKYLKNFRGLHPKLIKFTPLGLANNIKFSQNLEPINPASEGNKKKSRHTASTLSKKYLKNFRGLHPKLIKFTPLGLANNIKFSQNLEPITLASEGE